MMNSVSVTNLISPEYLDRTNEADLVKAAQKGYIQAFNQLILAYQDRIYSLALRILGDENAADDITQNTFMTAYTQLHRFRNGSFRGWLYRIATNACYDEYRRYKRHPVLSIDSQDLIDERMTPLYDSPFLATSPEMEAERDEQARFVQSALNQLDTDQRMVVMMVDQQDFDYQETALILRIPIGTVKSRLSRGRTRLHAILKKCDEGELYEAYN